ncbi:hypothetical protein [Kocuria marina]|uniref:hypothetical protein n=1 Tax=Kocuria marina TaxID=223184 RepID=UPI0012EB5C26|nr:hypothetical protein [Kocuria marina]
MTETAVNLVDDRQVTVELLANPLNWRVRVVEEISVDTATTCMRRRSLQVAPLREHIGAEVPEGTTHALLALYVAPMPRGPLLDFDVKGPEGEGWVLPRLEIAERQALYLEKVATFCGQEVTPELHKLLSAVCGFTGELLTDINGLTLAEYLEAGLDRPVPRETLAKWEEIGEICRNALRPRLDIFRGYSAPENPVLVLPELFAAGTLSTDDEATEWLDQYRDLVMAMKREAKKAAPNAAGEFLDVLADYANNYDLMVAMRVPLDEPFLVKIAERRDVHLSTVRNRGTQELVIADAQTNHVTFKVTDPNVWIRDFRALQPGSNKYSYGAFQTREDPQNRAFYAHDVDRDYRIRLSFQLGLLRRLQLVPYLATLLLALLILALMIEQPTDLRSLALIVGPAALAASVLLGREPSTLGSRLRWVSSVILSATLLTLILVSVVLYVWHPGDDQTGGEPAPGPTVSSQPSVPARESARPTSAPKSIQPSVPTNG